MIKNEASRYLFWDKYLDDIILKIENLISNKKDIYCDFHIHSNYSIDSNQSLKEIIDRANTLNLDVISITDHDSVAVYDELYWYLKNHNFEKPIIIPGIEFTIENKEYGSQFHILQLMINPKSKDIINDIKHQQKARWNRSYLQFERIKSNKSLQYFIKKYKLNCTLDNYKIYLSNCYRPIPEYATIMSYLNKLFKDNNISNWDILEQCKKWNVTDNCKERKKIKEFKYNKLYDKYKSIDGSDYNVRFLHSMIAVKGADDDFFPKYKCMGDLSVNSYGELKLNELNKTNLTVFAHPSESKLELLEDLLKLNSNIYGIELNKQCNYSNISNFNKRKEDLNMFYICGSDSHTIDSTWYDDINFYKMDKYNLKRFIYYSKKYRGINEKN